MSKPKQIFLHIGHYKTGSSALQKYLSDASGELRQKGFLYPECCRPGNNPTNHGHLSLSLAREHGFHPPAWYQADMTSDAAFAELNKTLRSASEDKIILSSEEFMQLALRDDPDAAVGHLKEHLSGHDVRIVQYLREPFALLKSWFNEVNKGPVATRTFPVFFMNLNEHFLAQGQIWECFAKHFGAENIQLITYGKSGAAHLSGFLSAIGCDLTPSEDSEPVQVAQPEHLLELSRLAKERHGSRDDYTITRIRDGEAIDRRARTISESYREIARRSDAMQDSLLTGEAVIDYYARLLMPLQKTKVANPKEAENLRDMALKVEKKNVGLARALMEAAQTIRPDGTFINKKVSQYRQKIANSR